VGFEVSRNLTLTTHVGPPTRMPELAREAIATRPDVVVAVSTVAILAAKEASSTVPIVMSFIGEDPVATGLADSLARPGHSATGVAMLAVQMDGKRTSLLHEFVSMARRQCIIGVSDLAAGSCCPSRRGCFARPTRWKRSWVRSGRLLSDSRGGHRRMLTRCQRNVL
jgi:ABC transporter substrate binding protein